jgi:hypothetical protein
MTYGTVANLKLRIGVTTAADDTVLGQLLDAASAAVDRLAGRTWVSGSATRYFRYHDGAISSDGHFLFLDAPVSGVTTLTNGDGVVVASTDYVLLPRNDTYKTMIELTYASALYFWFGTYRDGEITVLAAWVIPDNVTEAAYILAEALYRRGEESAVPYEVALLQARSLIAPPRLGVL